MKPIGTQRNDRLRPDCASDQELRMVCVSSPGGLRDGNLPAHVTMFT